MLIIAHRGDKNSGFPENSLSSIMLAKKNKDIYGGIEFDVRASKDRKFFLLHDKTLGRTTNMHGLISRKSSAQLNECHLHDGTRLPKLDEALKALKGYKGLVFVELKCKGLEDDFMKIIRKHDIRIIILSFSLNSLRRVRRIDKDIGFHLDKMLLNKSNVRKAKELKCYAIGSPIYGLRKSVVKYAKQQGLRVMPFMIGSERMLERAKRLDVDGIFADRYF